jgi:serine-type D-Ala-D-Ala carboxypeptidase/endopeptidase (penicillin-binding protein 4)
LKHLLGTALLLALAVSPWAFGSDVEARPAPPDFRPSDPAVPPRFADDVTSLRSGILRAIQATGWSNSEWGVLAVSLERGDTLMAVNPDQPLAPASNQKVLVSSAALHELGPGYRFPTFLLTDGEVEGGVLNGNLILYGTGDPAISNRILDSTTSVWEDFAAALEDAGIHAVTGNIVADESFFEGPKRRPSWNPEDLNDWYAAPVSALTFAENVVTLQISPGPAGLPATVRTEPEGAELPILNTSVSTPGASSRSLLIVRDDPDDPIEVRGQIGASDVWRELTVSDPASYAASVFRRVLQDEGIRVYGSLSEVRSDTESPLTAGPTLAPAFRDAQGGQLRTIAVHYSPPLAQLIQVLNKRSHNLYAEILFFTLGRMTSGDGSFSGGRAALGSYLSDVVGVPVENFNIEDGSGLSQLNRATPSTFIKVLEYVAASDEAEAFWASLPEAGNRRELSRMYQSPAAGNLKAKTGTIDRVSALSGIVRTADGERVLFSILSNNVPSSYRAKRVEDAIGIQLASFSRGRAATLGEE